MPSTVAFRNLLLDASDIDTISLHSGDPGVSGTANEVTGGGYARQPATFASAANGEKALSATVSFTTSPSQAVTHLGFWANTTFRISQIVTGDQSANANGDYDVTTSTKLTLSDV